MTHMVNYVEACDLVPTVCYKKLLTFTGKMFIFRIQAMAAQ